MCVESWGKVIRERLDILESWAHKQGLELAAECHLAKINQCADFLQVKCWMAIADKKKPNGKVKFLHWFEFRL